MPIRREAAYLCRYVLILLHMRFSFLVYPIRLVTWTYPDIGVLEEPHACLEAVSHCVSRFYVLGILTLSDNLERLLSPAHVRLNVRQKPLDEHA